MHAARDGFGLLRRRTLLLATLAACSPAAAPPPEPAPPPPPAVRWPEIVGSDDFVRETRAALTLIGETDADAAELIADQVRVISFSSYSASGPKTGRVRIAEPTWHAPGYSADGQLVWYACVLAHEAMHGLEADAGHDEDWGRMTPVQRNECERGPRAVQAALLEALVPRFDGKLRAEVESQRDYVRRQNASPTPPDYCFTNTRDW